MPDILDYLRAPKDLIPTVMPLRILAGLFVNEPILLIGSGPSSKQLKNKIYWHNIYSVGINHSCIQLPTISYCCQDYSFLLEAGSRLRGRMGYYCLPNCLASLSKINNKHILHGFYGHKVVCNEDANDLSQIKCPVFFSGALMVVIAALMGFSPIILVGYDMLINYQYAFLHPVNKLHNVAVEKRDQRKPILSKQAEFLKDYCYKYNIINCSDANFARKEDLETTLKTINCNNAKDISKRLQTILDKNYG